MTAGLEGFTRPVKNLSWRKVFLWQNGRKAVLAETPARTREHGRERVEGKSWPKPVERRVFYWGKSHSSLARNAPLKDRFALR
jgi:hypothetical protein